MGFIRNGHRIPSNTTTIHLKAIIRKQTDPWVWEDGENRTINLNPGEKTFSIKFRFNKQGFVKEPFSLTATANQLDFGKFIGKALSKSEIAECFDVIVKNSPGTKKLDKALQNINLNNAIDIPTVNASDGGKIVALNCKLFYFV